LNRQGKQRQQQSGQIDSRFHCAGSSQKRCGNSAQ
jgi:hypothetical protein